MKTRAIECLVIASDGESAEAVALRMQVRPQHMAAARKTVASGNMLIGDAILAGVWDKV